MDKVRAEFRSAAKYLSIVAVALTLTLIFAQFRANGSIGWIEIAAAVIGGASVYAGALTGLVGINAITNLFGRK